MDGFKERLQLGSYFEKRGAKRGTKIPNLAEGRMMPNTAGPSGNLIILRADEIIGIPFIVVKRYWIAGNNRYSVYYC